MARKKKTKRVPKGSHRMPDGTIMKDKAMKRKRGRKVKKAPALNRQEPWFLGRDYSSTSFTQLHQVNKYNHAVEGLEVLRGYTGRQNELDRRINEQKGSQDDLYKRVAQAERLTQRVARDYRADLVKEQRRGQKFQRDFKKEVEQEQQQMWQNVLGKVSGFDPQAFKKMTEHLDFFYADKGFLNTTNQKLDEALQQDRRGSNKTAGTAVGGSVARKPYVPGSFIAARVAANALSPALAIAAANLQESSIYTVAGTPETRVLNEGQFTFTD